MILFLYRVVPVNDDDEVLVITRKSARSARYTSATGHSDDDLSPDPLEPWSTKDLLNINKILEDSEEK